MSDKGHEAKKSSNFPIHTSEEVDAFQRATADGATGRNYENVEHLNMRVHRVPGLRHHVQVPLTPKEVQDGVSVATLERLTEQQDADAIFAFLYICHLLISPVPAGAETENPDVEIDDVIRRIGWDPRTKAERQEMRRRVWQLIEFGSRAEVVGQRHGTYKDPMTGEVLETEIASTPWSILQRERLTQPSLFNDMDIPLKVQLAVGRDWKRLLGSPLTAQYLPLGEALGAIPGNKPSGAWARVIGLALANFWRRKPEAALDGSIRPRRFELLERFPPKTGPVSELLKSTNPGFAMTYWCGALEILKREGFLEPAEGALETAQEMRARFPRKDWAAAWMEEKVFLIPGPRIRETIVIRAKALPPVAPPKRRGRPRKNPI